MSENEKEKNPKATIFNMDTGKTTEVGVDEFFDALKTGMTQPQPDLTQMTRDEVQKVLNGQRGYLCLQSVDSKSPKRFAVIFAMLTLVTEMPSLWRRVIKTIEDNKSELAIVAAGKYNIMDAYPKKIDELPIKTYESIDGLLEEWIID
jgi:hypothetical protein